MGGSHVLTCLSACLAVRSLARSFVRSFALSLLPAGGLAPRLSSRSRALGLQPSSRWAKEGSTIEFPYHRCLLGCRQQRQQWRRRQRQLQRRRQQQRQLQRLTDSGRESGLAGLRERHVIAVALAFGWTLIQHTKVRKRKIIHWSYPTDKILPLSLARSLAFYLGCFFE